MWTEDVLTVNHEKSNNLTQQQDIKEVEGLYDLSQKIKQFNTTAGH